jgi:hypothetical protein
MKAYFILLAILFAGRLFANGVVFLTVTHPVPLLRAVVELVCFGLCLWGCYGMAFRKRYLDQARWKIIYNLTLIVGVVTVVLAVYGSEFGIPGSTGDISLFHGGMILLPFLLFAVPVIIYSKDLEEGTIP